MTYKSESEKETREIAKKILEKIIKENSQKKDEAIFVGLVGDLGAGKTTFMKGVAEFFDVKETVSSPTFVIQKIYEIGEENQQTKNHNFKKLVHMDLYRLEDEKELANIKWSDYKKDADNIIFVEWPNQIWKDFPEDMIEIKIEHKSENEREIILKTEI